MKKLNQLLAALLSVAMLLSVVPAAAFAESDLYEISYDEDEVSANEIPEDYDEYGYYYGDDLDKIADAMLTTTTSSLADVDEEVADALSSSGMVDIVFLIDSTGSMADEIVNVRTNLNSFTQILEEAALDYQMAVIEYKDITAWDEESSTQVLQMGGETWLTSASDVEDLLSEITVSGGGDWKETVVDALGCMLEELSFRDDASKFAIILTDADYKEDTNYSYTGMDDVINELISVGISTSVISDTEYQSTYSSLYNGTDGIFCDIYGDFAESLVNLAAYVKEAASPVTIRLATEKTAEGSSYNSYTTTATIAATDSENTATGLEVTLELPSGFTVDGSSTQTISALAPGGSKDVEFDFNAPVKTDDKVYTIKVRVTSDSFSTGAVCVAQDTFIVPGSGETDYTFTFGEDNYSFLNTYDIDGKGFGYGTYYISDEDLAAFLEDLNKTEIYNIANAFAVDGTLENLINNNLITWEGACYGMALTAALFKVGLLDSEDWGSETTYGIPALNPSENSELESMINVYHISQMTDAAHTDTATATVGTDAFVPVAERMWEVAYNIGKEQTPFVLRLRSSSGGHAVLCYGAEECNNVYDGIEYDKCLLIADPNSKQGQYLYISSDNMYAYYSNDSSFNRFGYRSPDLSILDMHNYEDNSVNHTYRINAGEMSSFTVSDGTESAFIVDGEVVSGELNLVKMEIDGGGNVNSIWILPNEVFSLTIIPEAGETLDATVYFEDIALGVTGEAGSATMTKDGKIEVKDAEGEIEITTIANEGNIDFATITGNATGTVNVSMNTEASSINVKGDIMDTIVANTTRDGVLMDAVLGDEQTAYVNADGSVTAGSSSSDSAALLALGAGAVVAGTVVASEIASARAEAKLPDSSLIHVYENGTEKTFEPDVKGKTLTIKTEANTAVLTGSRSYIEQLSAQGYTQITLAARTSDKTLFVFPVTKKVTADISTLLAETPQDGTFTITLE